MILFNGVIQPVIDLLGLNCVKIVAYADDLCIGIYPNKSVEHIMTIAKDALLQCGL